MTDQIGKQRGETLAAGAAGPVGRRISVRAKLYTAFIALGALVAVSAAVSISAFIRVDRALNEIAEESVPLALAAMDLSRKAERIVAAAPALLAVESAEAQASLSTSLGEDVDALEKLLATLERRRIGAQPVASIRRAVGQLRQSLAALDRVMTARIALSLQKKAQSVATAEAAATVETLLGGWASAAEDGVRDARAAMLAADAGPQLRAAMADRVIGSQEAFQRLNAMRADAALLTETAGRSASAATMGDVQRAVLAVNWSLDRLNQAASRLDETQAAALSAPLGALAVARQVGSTRLLELQFQAAGEKSLSDIADLSSRFASAVDRLVEIAEAEILQANDEARGVQTAASAVLLGVAALSLIGAVLVIWLFVKRNVIQRLTALSDSMKAIAGGDLGVALPAAGGDEIGQMAQALRVFRDTAVEVRAVNLREVQEARRRLDDALESINEGFCLYDREERLVVANGRYREIMLGDRHASPGPGADLSAILRRAALSGRFPDAAADPDAWIAQQRARHGAGGEATIHRIEGDRWQRVSVRRTEQGGIVAVYADITQLQRVSDELRRAKDAAEAANEAKTAFLATMSHEIRTPLNAIVGMSRLMGDTRLDAEQSDYCSTVIQAADTLLVIINDILDFSKVEAGALELERAPVELETLVAESIELVSARAAEKGLELVSQLDAALPRGVWGDAVRLKQILLNLLNNAVKFTDSGEIVVTLRRASAGDDAEAITTPPGRVTLEASVSDTGIGIPPERMDRLFKSFSQVDASTTRRYGGSGLGLAISKRLVELMGGAIGVTSVEGAGATFSFTIPVEPAPISVDARIGDWIAALRQRHALVVDDNATSRRLLARRLQDWGITVTAEEAPAAALAHIRAGETFDVIVIDYRMPGMDGLELSRQIATVAGPGAPPRILLSAGTPHGPAFRQDVRAAGCGAVLLKPAKSRHLLKALADAIGGAPADEPETRVKEARNHAAQANLSILLVDDNALNRKVGAKILARGGYACALAASGEEAVRACLATPYDVVLMDIEMPDMDGVAAAALIRARLPAVAQPFIVALTANVLEAERDRYLRSGMDAYLSKPIDPQALDAALEMAARLRDGRHGAAQGAEREEHADHG